jgi:hypothetical protein
MSSSHKKWGLQGDISALMPVEHDVNGKKRDLGDVTTVWMFKSHLPHHGIA